MSWFTGSPPAAVHTHGALVLDVADVDDAAVLVRADGDTAAEVADDEVHVLILLTELVGRLAADGLVVERVELAQAAELGKAGVVRDLRHLIDAHGVDEEGGDADHVADLSWRGRHRGWRGAHRRERSPHRA